MLKVGQKVIFTSYNYHHGVTQENNFPYLIGEELTITELWLEPDGWMSKVKELGTDWYIPVKCFKVFEYVPPKTELEWLDRVRDNFKE
jgi:hypothetical protein